MLNIKGVQWTSFNGQNRWSNRGHFGGWYLMVSWDILIYLKGLYIERDRLYNILKGEASQNDLTSLTFLKLQGLQPCHECILFPIVSDGRTAKRVSCVATGSACDAWLSGIRHCWVGFMMVKNPWQQPWIKRLSWRGLTILFDSYADFSQCGGVNHNPSISPVLKESGCRDASQ